MSYKAQASVYNTDNGEKPPPSIEDERISPRTFYKLAALDLEYDSESESEIEDYEAYREPHYDHKYEERSRARSPSPEPVYRQSSSKYCWDSHRPQATYGREEYRRPTGLYPDTTEEYCTRKRAERAARATKDYEPQYRSSRRASSPDREDNRRFHVPYPSQDHYSSRARSPSPSPTRPRYQPDSSYKFSSSSYSSSGRTRAEKLRQMEEEREDREMVRENLQAKQELKKERLRRHHEEETLRIEEELAHIRLRREEEEDRFRQRQNSPDERHQSRTKHEPRRSFRYEEPRVYEYRPRHGYRNPEYSYDYVRKEVRFPEPRKGRN